MVDHSILIKILEFIGVRGVTLSWFQSYLSNRALLVKVDNELSDSSYVHIGVPQGSVLGPLFLIYINSLFSQAFIGKLSGFADDIAILYENYNLDNLQHNINHDLGILSEWLYCHCLLISDKTKLMQFKKGLTNSSNNIVIKYHGFDCFKSNVCSKECFLVENVNTFKYLGVLLDCDLNWKPHCNNIKKFIYMALCKFYMLRTLVPPDVLNMIYFALIQSKIFYGISFWGCAYDITLKPISIAQNSVVKIMCFKKKTFSAWVLYIERKILPLKHLYVFRVLKMFFSRSGNRMCKILKQYNLRRNNLCFVPKINSTLFQKCFMVSAPKLFNNIPNNIQTATSLYIFCKLLKEHLFTCNDINLLLN